MTNRGIALRLGLVHRDHCPIPSDPHLLEWNLRVVHPKAEILVTAEHEDHSYATSAPVAVPEAGHVLESLNLLRVG